MSNSRTSARSSRRHHTAPPDRVHHPQSAIDLTLAYPTWPNLKLLIQVIAPLHCGWRRSGACFVRTGRRAGHRRSRNGFRTLPANQRASRCVKKNILLCAKEFDEADDCGDVSCARIKGDVLRPNTKRDLLLARARVACKVHGNALSHKCEITFITSQTSWNEVHWGAANDPATNLFAGRS